MTSRARYFDPLRMLLASSLLLLSADQALGSGEKHSLPARWRDPVQQPFADDSIWNTPLGRGAKFARENDPETAMLRSDDIGGPAGAYPWIAFDAISLIKASSTDPVAKWFFKSRSGTMPWPAGTAYANGTIKLNTPDNIRFLGGSDGHAILIDPTGRMEHESWIGRWEEKNKRYYAEYLVRVDLRGSGIASADNRSEGIRAFGGSLLGGLIRCNEIASGDIPHAIATLLSTTQLRKAPTMAEQKTWPATHSDGGGRNDYQGLIPMGALLAIPPNIDIDSLGLSAEGRTLARAYQRFGGYVVDATTKTTSVAVLENGCDRMMIRHMQEDARKIRNRLVRVLNNGPDHPGGPGPRVAPPPPPLRPLASSRQDSDAVSTA